MKYMGSKNSHVKSFLPIILRNKSESMSYYEPFAGGCNVIDKISGERYANDVNPYLIELLKHVCKFPNFNIYVYRSLGIMT